MIKSYEGIEFKEIADSIVQLKNIRFVNPQYDLRTTFDRMDFTDLADTFKIAKEHIEEFMIAKNGLFYQRWSDHRGC